MEHQRTWADSILEHCESGIDVSLIDECLALTPEQRLDELQRLIEFFEEARGAGDSTENGHRSSPPAASSR